MQIGDTRSSVCCLAPFFHEVIKEEGVMLFAGLEVMWGERYG